MTYTLLLLWCLWGRSGGCLRRPLILIRALHLRARSASHVGRRCFASASASRSRDRMGNCCGSRRGGPSRARAAAPAVTRTWLETRLAEVLHAKERDGREIKHPFNKILLKFPLLRLVFQRVRQAFHSVDEASAPVGLCRGSGLRAWSHVSSGWHRPC